MYSRLRNWSKLILLGLLVSQANAAQLVEHSNTQSVHVDVSARETNRLSIAGRRLATVVPAQQGLIFPKEKELKEMDAQGILFFKMANDHPVDAPVTLFLSDDKGATYRLILVPRPIPGEDIIVQPPADKVSATTKDGKAASYQRRIKNLIFVMATNDSTAEKVQINQPVPLWKEGTLILATRYPGMELIGERYRLTNSSKTNLLLAEQELYRSGVLAVSVQNQTLTPGDSTDIFIVRERRDHE